MAKSIMYMYIITQLSFKYLFSFTCLFLTDPNKYDIKASKVRSKDRGYDQKK